MAPVTCEPQGHDRYRRTLAICSANHIDLNAWLVRQGWALSFVRYGDRYRAEENEARRERRGLWAGAFIAPWDWRHRSKRTEILGAGQVPIEAQKLLVRP
jgi:endonuclease YncB( thermonuclease family)